MSAGAVAARRRQQSTIAGPSTSSLLKAAAIHGRFPRALRYAQGERSFQHGICEMGISMYIEFKLNSHAD
jgi:hypothetical protein